MRDIQTIMDELQAAIDSQTEVREFKVRNVSKMAKNIQMGEIVEVQPWGAMEISTWARMGDMVTLGDHHRWTTFKADERLTVRRAYVA